MPKIQFVWMARRRVIALCVAIAGVLALGGSSAGVEGGAAGPLVLGDDVALGDDNALGDDAVLAIGDSILQWHAETGQAVPDVVGAELGRPVVNAARSGAHVIGTAEMAAGGYDIRHQYEAIGLVGFDWVIVDGGANDLNHDCDCGQCTGLLGGGVMDEIVSADGRSGEMVTLVERIVADGSQVVVVGYVDMPDGASFGFAECGGALAELDRRYALMAGELDGVWFVNAGSVVGADGMWAFDADLVHPSVAGSEAIGALVAELIAEVESGEVGVRAVPGG